MQKYKSEKERTTIAIRKETKKVFKSKVKKAKISAISYMDKIVSEAK